MTESQERKIPLKKVNRTINSLWKTLNNVSRKNETGNEYTKWENDYPFRAHKFNANSLEIEKLFRIIDVEIDIDPLLFGEVHEDDAPAFSQETLLPILHLWDHKWVWDFTINYNGKYNEEEEMWNAAPKIEVSVVSHSGIVQEPFYRSTLNFDEIGNAPPILELMTKLFPPVEKKDEAESGLRILRVKSDKHLLDLLLSDTIKEGEIEYEIFKKDKNGIMTSLSVMKTLSNQYSVKLSNFLFRNNKEEKVNDDSDQRLMCAFKIYDNEKKFLNTRNLELQEHVMTLYNNYLEKYSPPSGEPASPDSTEPVGGGASSSESTGTDVVGASDINPPPPRYVTSEWGIGNGEYKDIKDFVCKAILEQESGIEDEEFKRLIQTKKHLFPCPVCFILTESDPGAHAIIGLLFVKIPEEEGGIVHPPKFLMYAFNNHEEYTLNKWRIDSICFQKTIWVNNPDFILHKNNLPPNQLSTYRGFFTGLYSIYSKHGFIKTVVQVWTQLRDNVPEKFRTLQLDQEEVVTYSSHLQRLNNDEGICFLCFWLSFALFLHIRYNYSIHTSVESVVSAPEESAWRFLYHFEMINKSLLEQIQEKFETYKDQAAQHVAIKRFHRNVNEFIFVLFSQLCTYEKVMVPSYPKLQRAFTSVCCTPNKRFKLGRTGSTP